MSLEVVTGDEEMMEPGAASLTVEDLPEAALKLIFSFVRPLSSLLSCERTCTTFRNALADDSFWKERIEKKYARFWNNDQRLKTYREKACVARNLHRVRAEQKREYSNLLRDAFHEEETCSRWKEIIANVLLHYLPVHLRNGGRRHYELRGDTMSVVLEILQNFLILSFQRAQAICIETCPEDSYPTLTAKHLQLADKLQFMNGHCQVGHHNPHLLLNISDDALQFANSLLLSNVREKIIRAAAFRAGVPKMQNCVYDITWAALVKLLHRIFEPVCEQLVAQIPLVHPNPCASIRKQVLVSPMEKMRDIPPLPKLVALPNGHEFADCFVLTPVPRMIEQAATSALGSIDDIKVYDVDWLADGAPPYIEYNLAECDYHWEVWDKDDGEQSCRVVAEEIFVDLATGPDAHLADVSNENGTLFVVESMDESN